MRANWSRILVGLLVGVLAVGWAYALFGPRSAPPGTLDDRAFAEAAEPVCAATVEAIDGLPPAQSTTDAVARAAVIDRANDLLASQSSDLRAVAPTDGEDGRRVNAWLDDWDVYVADRQDYADRLRLDDDARFLETPLDGNHRSEALEFFASINDMPSCGPPNDLS